MKSNIIVAMFIIALTLAALTGCPANKPAEQPATPQEEPAKPQEQPDTTPVVTPQPVEPGTSPFGGQPPPEVMPPTVTPDKPAELPPLQVTPVKPDDPAADVVKAAFDKMKLGNSPTLGLAYRDWIMALYARDFDKAWNMYSESVHDKIGMQVMSETNNMAMQIKMQEGTLGTVKMSPEEQERVKNNLALLSDKLGKIRTMPDRKYHAYTFVENERVSGKNPADLFLNEGMEVVGESIKGDKACIVTNLPAPLDRLFFVKENGVWKIDFMRVPRIPLEQTPAPPPPQNP